MKRLQKLRKQKEKKPAAPAKDGSPNTDSTVSIKNAMDIDDAAESAKEQTQAKFNGCDNNKIVNPPNLEHNTENIQTLRLSPNPNHDQDSKDKDKAEDEEDDYDIFAQNDKVLPINTQKNKTNKKVAENLNLTHNWDDSDGYYVVVPVIL